MTRTNIATTAKVAATAAVTDSVAINADCANPPTTTPAAAKRALRTCKNTRRDGPDCDASGNATSVICLGESFMVELKSDLGGQLGSWGIYHRLLGSPVTFGCAKQARWVLCYNPTTHRCPEPPVMAGGRRRVECSRQSSDSRSTVALQQHG
jgi:hypothetical protein